MTLAFDRREELHGVPGTHALICGIGDYPNLGFDRTDVPAPFSYFPDQITSATLTARELHGWLVEHADDLAAPLATSRLLLAPIEAEKPAAELPTLNNFLNAAAGWREDAAAHREGVAIFYVAGHGLMLTRADQLVLLHDFADGVGSILRNAINVGSVWQGMAPTSSLPEIARTQLFFVDASQQIESLPDNLVGAHPTQVFDLPLESREDRVAITFTAARGQLTYGKIGGKTLFGEALLECLDGAAAEQLETGGWGVTTTGLASTVGARVREQSAEFGVEQDANVGGLLGSALIARLPAPPDVRVSIEVPDDARKTGRLAVRDSQLELVFERKPPLPADPIELELPAGLYMVEVESSDGEVSRQMTQVLPPAAQIVVSPVVAQA
jgi:hypothetical protein